MFSSNTSVFGCITFDNTAILKKPIEAQLAWAAGFIDGDGYISAVPQIYRERNSNVIRIRVDVSQNDYFTLSILKTILGESGHLNHMRRQANQNRQPYVLSYDGRHAINVINKIQPYLVRKSAEAQACINLFHEGQLDRHPGSRGLSPEVIKIRKQWLSKIKKLK